jgi:uncharacterized glyoxalase superfamily protein PhnB
MNELIPNLMVEDVNRTVDFYKKILGFELSITVPSQGRFHWALMKNGDAKIMFQLKESFEHELKLPKPIPVCGSLTLYIRSDDIGSLYDRIIDHVNLVNDMHDTFYDTIEFTIKDINNYMLTFAQDK